MNAEQQRKHSTEISRGRRKKRWLDCVVVDIRKVGATNWRRLAERMESVSPLVESAMEKLSFDIDFKIFFVDFRHNKYNSAS